MNFPPEKDAKGYVFRPGKEVERLQLIWEIYNWCGSYTPKRGYAGNQNRELPIAWNFAQIAGAIAGGYVIELSPYYKGVQLIRKNKDLWERVSKFVKLKTGRGCLPYDEGSLGQLWEQNNGTSAHDLAEIEREKQLVRRAPK